MGNIQKEPSENFRTDISGFRKFAWSFRYAIRGIKTVWQEEQNFRIEVFCGSLAIIAALVLNVDLIPILLCCALVLSLEVVNSALESIVDLVSSDYHSLAKQAKDMAAGAVLIAALFSVLVALYLFLPKLFALNN